jgi:hypothetical protein
VGELQGGNDTTSIYRVSIPDSIINHTEQYDADMSGPVPQLFRAFVQAYYPNNPSVLTISRLREYLLQVCNDPRRRRLLVQHDHHEPHPPSSVPHGINSNTDTTNGQLENVWLILSTGPISKGQVRHIDHIDDPNRQVCFLYMSENAPTTILYQLQEPNGSTGISNCQELMEFWEDQQQQLHEHHHQQQLLLLILCQLVLMPCQTRVDTKTTLTTPEVMMGGFKNHHQHPHIYCYKRILS